MKKLGKCAKGCLISGISIALVGAGLYFFNITGTISIVCIVTGTMCALVGTPYINGIEYPQMIKEQQLQHSVELASKKDYVERNIHKYGIGKDQSKEDILFQNFPELHITEETRKQVLEHPELHSGLSVRTRMGKFYTDEEWAQRREEVLSTPLPGGEEKGPVLTKKLTQSRNQENK